LSKQNPAYQYLGSRLHSLFFFGTPHRGAALAQTLHKILRISSITGQKAFMSNLEMGSATLRELNNQFRLYYTGIHLHSFTESKPMLGNELIVDTESATLGRYLRFRGNPALTSCQATQKSDRNILTQIIETSYASSLRKTRIIALFEIGWSLPSAL
jgi:hypothetical protein